jgi:hypothetical protein
MQRRRTDRNTRKVRGGAVELASGKQTNSRQHGNQTGRPVTHSSTNLAKISSLLS